MQFICPVCGMIYNPPKISISMCANSGCQMVIQGNINPEELLELREWQKSPSFNAEFDANKSTGKILGSYLGGDLPSQSYEGQKPFLLNKNVKVEIHVSESGLLFINVLTNVLFISKLSDSYVAVDSAIELENKMRVGKVAGIAATAALVLPQVALLGLIGGVRKQVNKETYILQVGTPNSGGAFLINEERDGRALARLKERFIPEVTAETSAPSTKDRLNELQTLLDDGLISNDEFAAKRAGIIAEM